MESLILGSFEIIFWKMVLQYLLIKDTNNFALVNRLFNQVVKEEYPNWNRDLQILCKLRSKYSKYEYERSKSCYWPIHSERRLSYIWK